MDSLAIPWLFLGPSGSGKISQARKLIEAAYGISITLPLPIHVFNLGGDNYEAKVYESPYHFEIDIPNLSMQDKQIIGELLTQFFSSGDVFHSLRASTRKLVILRRAHSFSLPAAIRVRAILQQYVLPSDGTGMIWMTAREMTGPLAFLEDCFVQRRIPRTPYSTWTTYAIPEPLKTEEAYQALEGRLDRATQIVKFFPDGVVPAFPRRIQDFYDELIEAMITIAQLPTPPSVEIIKWIRGRVYQALCFCQREPEMIDSLAAAVQRKASATPDFEPTLFWEIMKALAKIEPHTSYRAPLSLEAGFLGVFDVFQKHLKNRILKQEDGHGRGDAGKAGETETKTLDNIGARAPPHVAPASPISVVAAATATAAVAPKVVKRRAPARKKATPAAIVGSGENYVVF